jgi:hypothetical protein
VTVNVVVTCERCIRLHITVTMAFSDWILPAVVLSASMLLLAVKLVLPILKPTVVPYPWYKPENYKQRQRDKELTVCLAGSFNPPHKGHLAMMLYLTERFVRIQQYWLLLSELWKCKVFLPVNSYLTPSVHDFQVWPTHCGCGQESQQEISSLSGGTCRLDPAHAGRAFLYERSCGRCVYLIESALARI